MKYMFIQTEEQGTDGQGCWSLIMFMMRASTTKSSNELFWRSTVPVAFLNHVFLIVPIVNWSKRNLHGQPLNKNKLHALKDAGTEWPGHLRVAR
jgi:hypothetical protein